MTPAALAALLPLRTERLVLRPATDADLDDLLAYRGDPEVCQYLPFPAQSRDDAVRRLRTWTDFLAADPADHPDDDWALTLAAEHSGAVVGDVMLRLKAGGGHSMAELGYVFSPAVAGRGLATEAARAVVDLAFGPFGCHRVFAQLDTRNGASARLCERLGMTHEAHLRRDYFADGEWSDTTIYGLLAEEWAAAGAR